MLISEKKKFSGRSIVQTLIVSSLLLIVLSVAATFFIAKHQFSSYEKSYLPIYGTVADFTLTEKDGSNFSINNLKGNVWVADFMFTHCPGQCPLMNLEMNRLQARLPKDIRLVSFTVDPDRDTPAVLSQYAETYAAEKGRWFFLTGEKEDLNRVATSFYMSRIDDPNRHSIRLVLVDVKARIRGYYDPMDQHSVDKLLSDSMTLESGNHKEK